MPSSPAYRAAAKLLRMQEYSVARLRSKLLRKGHPLEEVEEALERLQRERFLNEQRYAERLAEKLLADRYTDQGIARELMDKEFDPDLCWEVATGAGVPDSLDELTEIAPLLGDTTSRIVRQAQKRGFSEDVIRDWAQNEIDQTKGDL